jgi:hypothetical protein
MLKAYENPETRDAAFEDLMCMSNCADAYRIALLESDSPYSLIKAGIISGTESAAQDMSDEEFHHFGVCPTCHRGNTYTKTGKTHVFFCEEHKVFWVAGVNLFSSWQHETEDEQRAA